MSGPDDADEFIDALTNLLKTILRMSGIPETELFIPVADEDDLHPEQSVVLPTKKAPEAVALLRRMPHVRHMSNIYLAPSMPMMNYWEDPSEMMWPYQSWHPRPAEDWKEKDPPAVIEATELPIAGTGDRYSHTLILDLSGPRITARDCSDIWGDSCTVHGSSTNCPLLCPHQSRMQRVPAVQLLRDYEQKFLAAEYMPDPGGPAAGALSPDSINDEDWRNRMQTVFLDCGWPGQDFDAARVQETVTAEGFMEGFDSSTDSEQEEDDD